MTALLAGCATGNILSRAETDQSVITGSIPVSPKTAPETGKALDEVILRNTIATANLTETGKAPISWANSDTGARGAIISIRERKDRAGTLCRMFTATMERFDGVSLVTGETCQSPDGTWAMRSFKTV